MLSPPFSSGHVPFFFFLFFSYLPQAPTDALEDGVAVVARFNRRGSLLAVGVNDGRGQPGSKRHTLRVQRVWRTFL